MDMLLMRYQYLSSGGVGNRVACQAASSRSYQKMLNFCLVKNPPLTVTDVSEKQDRILAAPSTSSCTANNHYLITVRRKAKADQTSILFSSTMHKQQGIPTFPYITPKLYI